MSETKAEYQVHPAREKARAEGAPAPWRSRIVGHGEEAPDQLLANPANWRIHPKHQQDALKGMLDEVGWVAEITVNKATGFVLDGHARVALAISRQEPTVPVKYVDLTPEEEHKVLLTLDPIATLAGTDRQQINDLLAEVQTEDEAVQKLLNDLAEQNRIDLSNLLDGATTMGGAAGAAGADAGDSDEGDDEDGDDGLQLSDTRQVLLIFDGTTHTEFLKEVRALQTAYHAETISDAVREAVARAHRDLAIASA